MLSKQISIWLNVNQIQIQNYGKKNVKYVVDSPKAGRPVAILNNSPKDETLIFNIDDSTTKLNMINFEFSLIKLLYYFICL